MTGSVKDGMALPILRRTCERETIALIVIVHMEALDEIVPVDDGDSIRMAQALARQLGLGVGISSGVNFLGAVQKQVELGPDSVVVTLFPDSNKKCLSRDLLHEEPEKENHMEPDIQLQRFTSIYRSREARVELARMAGAAG